MPTPLTILLVAAAGILLYIGVGQLIDLRRQPRRRWVALFGIECLLAAGYVFSCLVSYHARDVASYLAAYRWAMLFGRLLLAMVPWFIAAYADFRPKWFLALLSVGFVFSGVANVLSSHGVFFDKAVGLVYHETPWGEPLAALRGHLAWWAYPVYAVYFGLLLLFFLAANHLKGRAGRSNPSWPLWVTWLFGVVAFGNDTLLDSGAIRSIYLEEFMVVVLFVMMAFLSETLRFRAENTYRTVFQSMHEAVFVLDGTTAGVLEVNESAAKLYGASRDDFLDGRVPFLCDDTDLTQARFARDMLDRALKEGEVQVFDWRIRKPDGTIFWTEVALRTTNIDNRPVVLASVRDLHRG